MKRTVCPLHVYSGVREPRTLIKFDEMGEVLDFIDSSPKKVRSWTENEMVCPRETFEMRLCKEFIQHGDDALNNRIMEQASKWKGMILEMEPSLTLKRNWNKAENSVTFDAAAIAGNEEKPCFTQNRESDQVNPGKGDGAYRVVINTDICWWMSHEDGAIAMACLCLLLQEYHPVEVWVQQGWMGRREQDGVTLFPILTGNTFTPVNLAFWVGHEYKDVPFSYYVNRLLGRVSSQVAVLPELPCDLYLAGFRWPTAKAYHHSSGSEIPEEAKLGFLKDMAMQILFQENLSGWTLDQNTGTLKQITGFVTDEEWDG